MLRKDLNNYTKLFSHYTELRVQENRQTRITLVKGNIVNNIKNASSGVSARVYDKGSWGFASSPNLVMMILNRFWIGQKNNAEFLNFRENRGKNHFQVKASALKKIFILKKPD